MADPPLSPPRGQPKVKDVRIAAPPRNSLSQSRHLGVVTNEVDVGVSLLSFKQLSLSTVDIGFEQLQGIEDLLPAG